jgi:hypothetical protein
MNNKEQVGEYYSPRQYVQHVLPRSYDVTEVTTGIIRCKSDRGIDDEGRWDKIFSSIKEYFGDSFKEVYHNTCHNHVNFNVYYDYRKFPQNKLMH